MIIKNPLDMHLHLRDNNILNDVALFSAKDFRAGVIMPNLILPITTKEKLLIYKEKILKICKNELFTPLMTIFYQNYDFDFLNDIKNELFAIKLYPAGITTNSSNGINNFNIQKCQFFFELLFNNNALKI